MMSGSGPTVFGLFEDKDTAQKAYETLRDSGLTRQTFLTTVPKVVGNRKDEREVEQDEYGRLSVSSFKGRGI